MGRNSKIDRGPFRVHFCVNGDDMVFAYSIK
jgi:hypothetical protein